MTLKSWTASQTATWKKQGKTFITRFVFLPMIFIVHVVWLALVLCVLVPWLALDFLPKRRLKQLTSQPPVRLKPRRPYNNRPHLCRDGSSIFWEMPDGEIIPVEPLQASLILQEVAEVVGGALCHEMTRLPHEN